MRNLRFLLILFPLLYSGCKFQSSADGNFHPGVSGNGGPSDGGGTSSGPAFADLSLQAESSSSQQGVLTYQIGVIPQGGSKVFSLTVTNSGQREGSSMEVNITSAGLAFKGGGFPGLGGDCGRQLAPGASCRLVLECSPRSLGPITETLEIRYMNGGEERAMSARIGAISAGIIQFAPNATVALSETSLSVSWTRPAGIQVHRYTVSLSSNRNSNPVDVLPNVTFDGNATSGIIQGLPPGSMGRIAMNAVTNDNSAQTSPGIIYWTPFGAINEDNVSSVTWQNAGVGGWPELSLFISPKFSFQSGQWSAGNTSSVWSHVPARRERPAYNFGSRLIAHPDGFDSSRGMDIRQVWSDGESKVAIAVGNWTHQVFIFNRLPTSPETSTPDFVLGQSTFTGRHPNAGQPSVNEVGFNSPGGVCFTGSVLYVADTENHRILGWNAWPTQMGEPADFVIGQPGFTQNIANNGGISKGSLSSPRKLSCAGGKLIVTDTGNHRVLIWNSAPTTNRPADVVVGQSTESANGANGAGGASVGGLKNPQAVAILSQGGVDHLLVADKDNVRIVQFDSIPTADGTPFSRVYASGQYPVEVVVEPGSNRFWVATAPAYVKIFTLNTESLVVFDQSADPSTGAPQEFSHGSFTTRRMAYTISHWAESWLPFSLDRTSGYFSMTARELDTAFHGRLWKTPPKNGGVPLDHYQGAFSPSAAMPGTWSPTSVASHFSVVKLGNRVYWSDNGRILSRPGNFDANNLYPDIILGNQALGGGVVAPTTLDYSISPTQLATDGNILYVLDGHRIVGYHTPDSLNNSNRPIDFAIGQSTKLTRDENHGGVSASSFYAPFNFEVAEGKLIVPDAANHRVLIWSTLPTTTGVPADVVLGQISETSRAYGTSLSQMNAPHSATISNGKLIVADRGNKRILVWDRVPTESFTPADRSYDATRLFRFQLPSWFNWSEIAPCQIKAYDNRLYMSTAHRVLVVPDFF